MRILICDDDVMIQRELTKYLSEYFHRHNLRLPDMIFYWIPEIKTLFF